MELIVCSSCETIGGKYSKLHDGTILCEECGEYGALIIEQMFWIIDYFKHMEVIDSQGNIDEEKLYGELELNGDDDIQIEFDEDGYYNGEAPPWDDEGEDEDNG